MSSHYFKDPTPDAGRVQHVSPDWRRVDEDAASNDPGYKSAADAVGFLRAAVAAFEEVCAGIRVMSPRTREALFVRTSWALTYVNRQAEIASDRQAHPSSRLVDRLTADSEE